MAYGGTKKFTKALLAEVALLFSELKFWNIPAAYSRVNTVKLSQAQKEVGQRFLKGRPYS